MSEGAPRQSIAKGPQGFTLRASGAIHQGVDYFLGKFPEKFSEFQEQREGWKLQRKPEDKNARQRGPAPLKPKVMPWVLQGSPGHTTHIGVPEAGAAGAGAGMGYFMLVKEGPNFTVLPVKEWYNFRSVSRGKVKSLEEAEREMSQQGQSIKLAAKSKLGALAAKAAVEGVAPEEEDQEGDAPDSDEEREMKRVARMKNARARVAAAGQEDMPGLDVSSPEGPVGQPNGAEKGDDWEHEEEHADDDLEQGDNPENDDDLLNTGVKKEEEEVDSEEEDGQGRKLTESGRRMAGVLREVKLDSDSEGGEDDSDSDVDLDEMDSKLKLETRGASSSRQPTPQPSNPAGGRAGTKRKAITPPAGERVPKGRAEAKQGGAGPSGPAAAASPAAADALPTRQEIVALIRNSPPMTSQELAARLKGRLGKDGKKALLALLKGLVTLKTQPDGRKTLQLK